MIFMIALYGCVMWLVIDSLKRLDTATHDIKLLRKRVIYLESHLILDRKI
jgi:hypothetical protein